MKRLPSVAFAVALALVLGTSALLPAAPVLANALGRDRDPLVLTGASLASLVGTAPSRIVAFRWDDQWTQNPVQVDERTLVDFGAIYDTTATGFTVLAYADTSTSWFLILIDVGLGGLSAYAVVELGKRNLKLAKAATVANAILGAITTLLFFKSGIISIALNGGLAACGIWGRLLISKEERPLV